MFVVLNLWDGWVVVFKESWFLVVSAGFIYIILSIWFSTVCYSFVGLVGFFGSGL